ncbi:glycoside hydrolase family 18 protein [Earliella scabrosa]|nr:glycoside hydrolase family 18 protein [Earliella scabrosa]
MLASTFRRIAAFMAVYLLLGVVAAPFDSRETYANSTALVQRDLEARAPQAAPHFVVYGDKYIPGVTGPPTVAEIRGFNVYMLSFWLIAGAWDKAYEWTTLTAAERATIKSQYNAAGIKLMVSAFGATDVPTTSRLDPVTVANNLAGWVKQWDLDGVDVDYEDFGAMDSGTAEAWLISFTRQLRAQLPANDYIITHAPVAPWFTPSRYPGGGYLRVHREVGSLIDWYNVQFYNQGVSEYTTCANLVQTSSGTWPQTALMQIIASGVPASKLVIGKPATTGDANNGYIAPQTLASCVAQAKNQGWNGGVMVWQYPNAGASWIQTVRSQSWPV